MKFMCWLKPVLSPQNNGDFSALQIPSRYLGLNSYSCALTSFQWSTYQNHCLYGGLTNGLHKQQTDEKSACIKTGLMEKVPVGEPRGFQVIGWQGAKKICFGSRGLSSSEGMPPSEHHGPALACFLAMWMFLKLPRGTLLLISSEELLSSSSFFLIWLYDRVETVLYSMFWNLAEIFLIFFWNFLKFKFPPLCSLNSQVPVKSQTNECLLPIFATPRASQSLNATMA